MIIGGLGQVVPARGRPAAGARSGGAFRMAEPGAAPESAKAASPVTLPSLLAMQEAESDALQDRDARRHGAALMEELVGLQRAILGGAGDMARLAALAARPPMAADPRLGAVLRAIQLRARIELARYTAAASG